MIIVDRHGERWAPFYGEQEIYLPIGHKSHADEVVDHNWEWPGYPDRSFEKNRR